MKSAYIVLTDQCHFADMQKQMAASIDKQGSCEGLTGRRFAGVSDYAPYETPSAFTVSSCPQVINLLSQVSKLGFPRPALGSTGR
jgi:hypothetical protein